ncbi:MAG: PAS domain S-box protein, partial [Usitatibacteraceae bacterium]
VEVLTSAKAIPRADWILAASLPVSEASAAFRTMRERMMLATFVLSLLVGIVMWLMLRRQLSPLLSTVKTLAGVSAGHPPAPLPVTRNDEIGELIGAFNRMLDTLRQREDALQRSDERFRSLTALSSDWYWEQDKDLRLSFHSTGVDLRSGSTSNQLIGTRRWESPDRVPLTSTWDEHRAMLEARLPFRDFEYISTGVDGKKHFVSVSGEPIYDADGNFAGYRGSGRNITDRKRAEMALHESEERYRTLVEWSPEPVVVHRDGNIIYVNPAAAKALGASSAQEIVGKQLLEFVHPDSRELVQARRKSIAGGAADLPRAEVKYRRFDGTILIAAVQGTSIIFDGAPAMHISMRDITDHKRAEADRAMLEAQLRESQKMQAIGTLAGGIAHDFNNILATILGNADLARQDVGNYPMALESLEEIRKAGARARDLVQQILSFSRRQPTDRKPCALAPVVEEAARLLRATLPARLALKIHCAPDVPAVLADATQIQQVVLNLATNAMQAITSGLGQIDIRLDAVTLDADFAEAHPALRTLHHAHPGRTVRLIVRDNGPGMDAATRERIFEPFFTTKPVDAGTGLGLSVVHGIVQAHEVVITVESEPGKGTSFTLYLPAAAEDVAAPIAAPRAPASAVVDAAHAGLHILYIDDNESLVSLITRMLERRGYRITGCCDQRKALAAIRADAESFDLVVTDYNMPGMSGLEVAREIRSIRGDLPVAIASGFIDEELRAQSVAAGVSELIFKASSAEDFCEAFVRLANAARKPLIRS